MNTTEGDPLAFVKSMIGGEFTESPSPFGRWLKGRILAADHGKFSMSFDVREEFTNPMGYLHGGVIAAIADDMIGATILMSSLARLFMSVNLHVEYIASSKLGDSITARTQLIESGKTILNFDWSITGQSEKLLNSLSFLTSTKFRLFR